MFYHLHAGSGRSSRGFMTNIAGDGLKKIRIVLSEAASSFQRNNDLSLASSLAFSATLALIPSLFLLTFVLGAVIGSSGRALARTQDLLTQVIPAYSHDILREVQFISSHAGTISVVNGLVLLWSVTPLIADFRISLGTIFRKKPTRPFLLEKLLDVAISIVFLLGLSAIAVAGVFYTVIERKNQLHLTLTYFEQVGPFLFVTAIVFLLYYMFSKRRRPLHLLIGAVVTAVLWFTIRPAFHLFLLYNPGYGFAFGSFKSLFVVIIWIYFSLVAFLFGGEIAASLGRDETVYIKKLMEGKRNVPAGVIGKYVVSCEQGRTIFDEGDPGKEMFSVLTGRVAIMKGGKEIAVITPGKCFGGMSFLLASSRAARAVALDDVELVTISNENINNLMNEYPEFVLEILREMAERFRESNKVID
jgi:YihY family inner membrane protein